MLNWLNLSVRQIVTMVATVVFLGTVVIGAPASAVEITDAINNITVTTTEEQNLFGGMVEFDMDFCVPDNSAEGDFFTLTLPPELTVPDSFTFNLPDSSGNTVAIATVSNNVITFTLTAFVEGRQNVCGTAFLEANIDSNNAVADATNDLEFVTASTTFTGQVDIGPDFGVPDDSRKFGRTLAEPSANGNELVFGIDTRPFTAADVGQTVSITDTPSSSIEIDCSTAAISLRNGTDSSNAGGVPTSVTETCTPAGSTLTFVVTADMIGFRVRLAYEFNILDDTVPEYANDGTVDIGGETTAVGTSEANLTGGGTGSGDVFDLALLKQLADGSNLATVAPGDTVTFTLTIMNQGGIDATEIELVDFVPAGLTLADPNWVSNSDGAASLVTPIAALAAGASTTVDISFTVDATASGTIDNFAEISGALDGDGNPATDIDSTPDATDSDLFANDDDVASSGLAGGDEDDHDRAQLTIASAESLPLTDGQTDGSDADGTGDSDTLARTGVNSGTIYFIAAVLIALGTMASVASRRRQAVA